MAQDISPLLDAGQLRGAIDALTAALRAAPTDHASRAMLGELLCLAGEFDRAEAQFGVLTQQTVDRPVAIARMRHLIRAAVAREAWFNQGAVPALLSEPTAGQRAAIDLSLAMRAGDEEAIAALLEQAEGVRPKLAGTVDGAAFDDFRDVDDRSAWFVEVLTGDGGYLWVDPASIAGLRFTAAARPIDLLWREARMALHDGRVADIVIPAQYVDAAASEAHRLARETDWNAGPGGAATGTGQRVWLLGEEGLPILDIREIVFTPAGGG